MTKRWKSMSDAVHDIVCRSKTQPSKGAGIGIGGTGKAGTTTTLIGCSCVHTAQHAQHVVQPAQHDDLGLRRSISNITLATQPGNIRFASAGEESSHLRIKQERVSSAVVSSKSVSSSWVSYSGRVLGPWPTPVATSDVYTGGPNAKPSMEERKRVTRRQQQCKQT
jgi:hypothetical protein